jgi:hypothetical protein
MTITQQSGKGASPSTQSDARLIPTAATVDPGRRGRTQEKTEPFGSTCVHHQVRRMGNLGSQTAPQTDSEHDLGHSHELNDDSDCPIALEQMLQAVTAQTENLELLIHVMRSSTDEISNHLLTRLRSGSSTEDLIELIQIKLSD